MEEAQLMVVVGFGVGIIVTTIVGWRIASQKAKNVELLSQRDLKTFRLPNNDKRLIKIFTKIDQDERVEFAEDLLKQFKANYSRALRSLETEQEEMDDLMRELNRIQSNVDKKKTKGEKDAMFMARMSPQLTKMKDKLEDISLQLESLSMIAPINTFLKLVVVGHGRVAAKGLYDRGSIVGEPDVKLKEAMQAANKVLSLGESEFEKAIETWIIEY
jgi:hypothetical protein